MTTSTPFGDPRDSARASESYDLLRSDIEALPAANLDHPWLGQPEASRLAWMLAERASEPERLARLQSLSPEFDPDMPARLNHLGWAYFHIQTQFADAGATYTQATIPKELAEEAAAMNRTLMRVLDYNLGALPDAAAKLASIRAGQGYQDTASDLHRLAALCDEHEARLLNDGNNYHPEMPSKARELSAGILQELASSQSVEVAHWGDHRRRCFTLLRIAYNDVRDTCRWLHRHEPEQAAAFGPLARATRPGSKSTSSASSSSTGTAAGNQTVN